MKSSNSWGRSIKAGASTLTALVLAVIIAGMSITPVLAKDDRWDRGREKRHEREYRRHRGYYERGRYYRPAPDYYAPPPVVYAPPAPPPGITFVFPLHIR